MMKALTGDCHGVVAPHTTKHVEHCELFTA